jgi:hypothetical protein
MEVPCYGMAYCDVTVQLNWPTLCIPDCCTCVSTFCNCCNPHKHDGYCMENISWPVRVINGGLQSLGGIQHEWSRNRGYIRKLCTYYKNYRVI